MSSCRTHFSSLLINTSITHHALAEVIGVHPWQRAHEQREHMRSALWVTVARGNQAAGHADHAAERGGEGVRLSQGLHRRVGPVTHEAAKSDERGQVHVRVSENKRVLIDVDRRRIYLAASPTLSPVAAEA